MVEGIWRSLLKETKMLFFFVRNGEMMMKIMLIVRVSQTQTI